MISRKARVCVIGAGLSGLVSCREALRAGLEVRVFESADSIGGVWRSPSQGGLVWEGMRANLSAHSCAFSDWPWTHAGEKDSNCANVSNALENALKRECVDLSIFPTESAIRSYLRTYCDAFELWNSIELNSEVCGIRDTKDGKEEWLCKVKTGNTIKSIRFDYVIVCCGVFHRPHIPDLFQVGNGIIHSKDFASANDVGEKVLVVGGGFSGCEIATVIARERKAPVVHSVGK